MGARYYGQGLGATTRVTLSDPCLRLVKSGTDGLLEAVGICDNATTVPAQIMVTSNLIDVLKNYLSNPHIVARFR